MLTILVLITLLNRGGFIHKAELISVLLIFALLDAENVFLVERLRPPLRDTVLHLILHGDFIWGAC